MEKGILLRDIEEARAAEGIFLLVSSHDARLIVLRYAVTAKRTTGSVRSAWVRHEPGASRERCFPLAL